MLSVPKLNFGSIDAVNYRQRDQKEFLQKILYKEHYLSEILKSNKYFLIGEKGTGKTSYSVFLENGEYENTRAKVIELNGTDYQKFIGLKESGKLDVSSYSDVWTVILLLLISDTISKIENKSMHNFHKFISLRDAINEYYSDAFKPEVDYSLELVSNSERMLSLVTQHSKLGPKDKDIQKPTNANFQVSLFSLQKKFEEAISSIKIQKNVILFIDGIDIRPEEIEYSQYIKCIRGLTDATWKLNTEFFANIKDSPGRVKICLLMRPDILDQMGFQNLNAKVRDNGVVLNWQTTYEEFRSSPIYKMVCGIIARQQETLESSEAVWKHYFPYRLANQRVAEKFDDPFVGFLRYSFYRPRDIVQYLTLMQDYVTTYQDDKENFTETAFHKCERNFSEYLLGEVKDYLGFYYGTVDFDQIVGFFAMLGGQNHFSWEEFVAAFSRYKKQISLSQTTVDEIKGKPEEFLEFLYSLNIVGYMEPKGMGGSFVHWCFRDRTPVKLRPKVKTHLSYSVHPGLARSLLVGGSEKGKASNRRGYGSKRTTLQP